MWPVFPNLSPNDALRSRVHMGGLVNNCWGLAAQFQGGRDQVLPGLGCHFLAYRRAAWVWVLVGRGEGSLARRRKDTIRF